MPDRPQRLEMLGYCKTLELAFDTCRVAPVTLRIRRIVVVV